MPQVLRGVSLTRNVIASMYRKFAVAGPKRKAWMAKEFLLLSLFQVLAIPLYIGLRMLSKGRPVRIGSLNNKGKISIMVSYIEPYMRQLQANNLRTPLVIVLNPGLCPNEQMSKMYGRTLWLLDDRHQLLRAIFTWIYRIFLRTGSPVAAILQASKMGPYLKAWEEGKPILGFTAEEEKIGSNMLRELGVPSNAPYICFGFRESVFYEQVLRTPEALKRHQDRELDREFEADSYIRNPQLKDFIPMATECAENGLYVLRMGHVVGEPLTDNLHPNILDYAKTERNPFNDVYLLANCKFVVAGGSGLWWIATAFDRPAVVTDAYYLYWRPHRQGDLFIPPKFYNTLEQRLLTFEEMMNEGAKYTFYTNCVRDGIELIHNTPREIASVVREMDQRLDGTWQTSAEDQELQVKFDSLYRPEHMGYGLPGYIGSEFLRQHAGLL